MTSYGEIRIKTTKYYDNIISDIDCGIETEIANNIENQELIDFLNKTRQEYLDRVNELRNKSFKRLEALKDIQTEFTIKNSITHTCYYHIPEHCLIVLDIYVESYTIKNVLKFLTQNILNSFRYKIVNKLEIDICNERNIARAQPIDMNIYLFIKRLCCDVDVPLDKIKCFNKIEYLECRMKKIKESLDEIYNLTNLQGLNIMNFDNPFSSSNPLTNLSDRLINLKQLQEFNISYTSLEYLPNAFGELVKLKRLSIYKNKLFELPDSIGDLVNLERLDVGGNQLRILNNNICKLNKLIILEASENKLKCLPYNIGNLSNLKEIYLRDNKIKKLPKSLNKLTNVIILNISRNKLYNINKITSLINLKILNISSNNIKTITRDLEKLNKLEVLTFITSNDITIEKIELASLTNLTISINSLIDIKDNIKTPKLKDAYVVETSSQLPINENGEII